MMLHMRQCLFPVFMLVLLSVFTCCAQKKTEQPRITICAEPPVQQERPVEPLQEQQSPLPSSFVHTVTLPGENLSIIAKWYTGEAKNWEMLAQYNPAIDPNRIFMGDEIQIPRELMIREEPLPKEFVDKLLARKKNRNGKTTQEAQAEREHPAAEPVISEEGIPLFGPRDYGR